MAFFGISPECVFILFEREAITGFVNNHIAGNLRLNLLPTNKCS